MISGDERREVAARLRGFSDTAKSLEAVGDALDLATSVRKSLRVEPFARGSEVLGRLADLVAPPTCHVVEHEVARFECRDGITVRTIAVRYKCSNCGADAWEDHGDVSAHCPVCGALVVDGSDG